MIFIYGTRCCAVFELDGISSVFGVEEAFRQSVHQIKRVPVDFPFVTFTGVTKFAKTPESYLHVGTQLREDNYGEALAKYIEQNKLGTIVRSGSKQNWSDNHVQLWIWVIDRKATYAHLEKLDG